MRIGKRMSRLLLEARRRARIHEKGSLNPLLCFAVLVGGACSAFVSQQQDAVATTRLPRNHEIEQGLQSSGLTRRHEQYPPFKATSLAPLSFWFMSPTRLECQAAAQEQNEDESSYYYEQMKVPERGSASSHVVFGQLLQPGLIERYHVYKRVQAQQSARTTSRELVVADIRFGSKLDGHKTIVHGGILALIMDDLMGFAYESLNQDISMAVTANLNVDFRTAVSADSNVVVRIELVQQEDRKLYFDAKMTNPNGNVLHAEAAALMIIPREHYRQDASDAA